MQAAKKIKQIWRFLTIMKIFHRLVRFFFIDTKIFNQDQKWTVKITDEYFKMALKCYEECLKMGFECCYEGKPFYAITRFSTRFCTILQGSSFQVYRLTFYALKDLTYSSNIQLYITRQQKQKKKLLQIILHHCPKV